MKTSDKTLVYLSDDLRIDVDRYNFILVAQSKVLRAKSKNFGKSQWKVIGYYSKLSDLMKDVIDGPYCLSNKEFENLKDLLKHLADKTDEYLGSIKLAGMNQ